MSYPCKVGSCSKVIKYYSTPTVLLDGVAIGTETENCARKIRERRMMVSQFSQAPPTITPSATATTALPTISPLICEDDELAFELDMHIPKTNSITIRTWSLSVMYFNSAQRIFGDDSVEYGSETVSGHAGVGKS